MFKTGVLIIDFYVTNFLVSGWVSWWDATSMKKKKKVICQKCFFLGFICFVEHCSHSSFQHSKSIKTNYFRTSTPTFLLLILPVCRRGQQAGEASALRKHSEKNIYYLLLLTLKITVVQLWFQELQSKPSEGLHTSVFQPTRTQQLLLQTIDFRGLFKFFFFTKMQPSCAAFQKNKSKNKNHKSHFRVHVTWCLDVQRCTMRSSFKTPLLLPGIM